MGVERRDGREVEDVKEQVTANRPAKLPDGLARLERGMPHGCAPKL